VKISTRRPSKSYAFDFKGKITGKIFLRFRRLSGSVGRFMVLRALGGAPDSAQKYRYECYNTLRRPMPSGRRHARRRQLDLAEIRFSGYITGNRQEVTMGSSQKRAIQNYRSRLSERGLARFEVLGRDADRDLIRSLARRLAEDGPEASRLRAAVNQTITGEPPKRGGILAALRRSPLVGADLDLTRPREEGRKVDL
jgi:hypothetical protein